MEIALIVIIVISIFILFKKNYLGLTLAMLVLFGSDTDSSGILNYLDTIVPYYNYFVKISIFVLTIISIVILLNGFRNKKIKLELFLFVISPILIVGFIIFIIELLRNGFTAGYITLIWNGFPFFFISLAFFINNSVEKFKETIINIIVLQAVITLLILIFPIQLQEINGVKYAYLNSGLIWIQLWETIIQSPINFTDFNKQSLSVLKFAQFHNPNTLGLYSVFYLLFGIYLINYRKKINFAVLLLLSSGYMGWMNSLTRGPLVALLIGIFIYFLFKRYKSYLSLFKISTLLLVFVIFLSNSKTIFNYFYVGSDNISIQSRIPGYEFAFNAIYTSPILGVPVEVYDPIPHIFFLKIAASYGLFTGLILLMPFIYIGIKIFVRVIDFRSSLLEISLITSIYLILLSALLTNGVIAYIMFWLLFAYIAMYFNKSQPLLTNGVENEKITYIN